MSLIVPTLIFAALAIALVAILMRIARQVRAKRPEQAPPKLEPMTAEPAAKKGLGRKKAAPEPEAEPAPPVARRRQLSSFAENERLASEEAEPTLPVLPTVYEDDALASTPAFSAPAFSPPADEPLPHEPEHDEPAAAAAPATPEPETPFDAAVLDRLERAFEAFEAGAITLAGYREILDGLEAEVDRRLSVLEPAGESPEFDAALAAREAVLWCQDWVAQQEGGTPA